jgi:hypothetical protein
MFTAVRRRFQLPATKTLGITAKAVCSRLLCTTKSDIELQRGYTGLIPRVMSILNLLADDQQMDTLKEFESKKIVTNGSFRKVNFHLHMFKTNKPMMIHITGIMQLFTYADLQNPLLKKYDFDPVEFMGGSISRATI